MAQKNKGTVLVVDDEADAVEFVRTALEEAGYEVAAASNADEGLAIARTTQPRLVIMDVQMPGKDGFSAFAEMSRDPRLRTIPVVMLTGVGGRLGISFSAQQMGDFLGEEPAAYVEKPVDPGVLQQTVQDVLGG